MKPVVLVATLALGICSAACSGEPAGDPVVATPEDVVPAAPPPAPAPAPDLPGPAAGRWSFNESADGATLPREGHCLVYQPTLKQAYDLYRQPGRDCAPVAFRQEGASILGAYACGDNRTEITITGSLASAYTMTEVMTSANPPGTKTIITIATRTGECSGQPEPPPLPDPSAEPPAQ
jgi:hypothetical protein